MVDWVIANKEWVLSGIGVFVFNLLFQHFKKKKAETKQIQGKQGIQVGGNVSGPVNLTINSTDQANSKNSFKLIIFGIPVLIIEFALANLVLFICLPHIAVQINNLSTIDKKKSEQSIYKEKNTNSIDSENYTDDNKIKPKLSGKPIIHSVSKDIPPESNDCKEYQILYNKAIKNGDKRTSLQIKEILEKLCSQN